jgi:cephalosporin hydroxylase
MICCENSTSAQIIGQSLIRDGILRMRVVIDTQQDTIEIDGEEPGASPLYSDEGFARISELWLKVGWNQKHLYSFSWLGRPIIQYPEDMVRLQEVIFQIKPDVILETGVAHGGSLVYSASLCKVLGKGRVIGVDVEIRPHNRQAIEAHFLSDMIQLVEGNSVDPKVIAEATSSIQSAETVLVILDSNHSHDHVMAELEAYHKFVTRDSYIVATDGIMEILNDVPRGNESWTHDNPSRAAREFAASHPDFELLAPAWPFNESTLSKPVTHWPDAWLRRKG